MSSDKLPIEILREVKPDVSWVENGPVDVLGAKEIHNGIVLNVTLYRRSNVYGLIDYKLTAWFEYCGEVMEETHNYLRFECMNKSIETAIIELAKQYDPYEKDRSLIDKKALIVSASRVDERVMDLIGDIQRHKDFMKQIKG